jgi:hypothetical protein
MEGFKNTTKIQYFKDGGSVKEMCYGGKMKAGGKAMSEKEDVAKDKVVVKKAFAMHDKQEHPGEKTDLSKLRKGGRAKKEVGTVKKYKCGGGVYGSKKTDADIKNIDDAKDCKPKKLAEGGSLKDVDANENPGLAKLPTNVRNKMGYAKNGGKAVKKMANGGSTTQKLAALEQQRAMEKMARAKKYLGPAQQSELINQSPEAAGLSGQGAVSDAERSVLSNMGASSPMKKGGKATKKC